MASTTCHFQEKPCLGFRPNNPNWMKNFNSGGQEALHIKARIHPFYSISWSHCSDQRAVSQEDTYSGYTIVSRRTEPGATAGAGASVFAYGWPTRSSSQNTNQRTKTLVKGRQNWTPKTLFKAQVLSTPLPQQNKWVPRQSITVDWFTICLLQFPTTFLILLSIPMLALL